jgi:phosphatidate cytidylyltransferase
MLRWRLLFGTLFIAALVLWCWLDAMVTRPGAFLLPLALMLSWLSTEEMLDMLNRRGRYPLAWVAYVGVLSTVVLSGLTLFWPGADQNYIGRFGWLAVGLLISLLLALFGELQRYGGQWHSTLNVGLSMFIVAYVGGLMGCIVQLRLFPGNIDDIKPDDGRIGLLALVSLIAIVKMSDTGQYVVGRLIGRHKLAKVVSPGKTWEGAIGGLVFALAAAWVVFAIAAPQYVDLPMSITPLSMSGLGLVRIGLYAVALVAAGLLGDLGESMLKRDAEVKDSSSWLPGFGGVLDLLDSLLGAAPIAYLFWALGIVGP